MDEKSLNAGRKEPAPGKKLRIVKHLPGAAAARSLTIRPAVVKLKI